MTNAVFIKFDPDKLARAASDISHQNTRFEEAFSDIVRKSKRLTLKWAGESADAYMDNMLRLKTQSDTLLRELKGLAGDLSLIATVYLTGEKRAGQETNSLPVDGVFNI